VLALEDIFYVQAFIKKYFQNREGLLKIVFSEERTPLGTAGAIKNAERFISTSPFLVVNGDSYCDVDLKRFLSFHLKIKALASIVLTSIEDANDYGNVTLGKQQRIINFVEKARSRKDSFISAGIYLFQREILSLIPADKKYSLEKELFPAIVNKEFYGYIGEKTLIDIGTPQRYRKAYKLLGT
jgi:NDP-sugar pyrophosphorylase family protein